MGAAHATNTTSAKMESSDSKSRNRDEDQRQDQRQRQRSHGHGSSSTRPLSIEGAASVNDASRTLPPMASQPRQPTSLQGVLRYAMEAREAQSDGEPSHFEPMDEERKEFLKKTLTSLTGSIIDELQNAIKVLSDVVDLRPDDDASSYEAALEQISDYVDNMDIANDFYKIGGFAIFGPCLNSPHSSIRWRAADVIAELAQNNPFCQDRFVESGLFPILLNMIDTDPAETVRVKALYAVSCIVREHPMSLKCMDEHDGYSILLRAMQSSVKKLQIKSAFLLSSLCYKDDAIDLKLSLINMGLVEQVAGLLTINDLQLEIRDQLLNILDGLTNENFQNGLAECRRPELCLQLTLERYMKELEKEDCPDQVDICRRILQKAFPEPDNHQER